MCENFMKKSFTLAEVLITLGIIGVIASITIPILVNNIRDQQLKTAMKENYSILSQAFKQMASDNGEDISSFMINHSMGVNNITPYLKVTSSCQNGTGCPDSLKINWVLLNGSPQAYNWYPTTYTNGINTNVSISTIGLANGAVFSMSFINPNLFNYTQSCFTSVPGGGWNTDFGSKTIHIFLDVNGQKGPNQFGRDVYIFYVTPAGRVIPAGGACSTDFSASDCTNGYGFSCTAVYLTQ